MLFFYKFWCNGLFLMSPHDSECLLKVLVPPKNRCQMDQSLSKHQFRCLFHKDLDFENMKSFVRGASKYLLECQLHVTLACMTLQILNVVNKTRHRQLLQQNQTPLYRELSCFSLEFEDYQSFGCSPPSPYISWLGFCLIYIIIYLILYVGVVYWNAQNT